MFCIFSSIGWELRLCTRCIAQAASPSTSRENALRMQAADLGAAIGRRCAIRPLSMRDRSRKRARGADGIDNQSANPARKVSRMRIWSRATINHITARTRQLLRFQSRASARRSSVGGCYAAGPVRCERRFIAILTSCPTWRSLRDQGLLPAGHCDERLARARNCCFIRSLNAVALSVSAFRSTLIGDLHLRDGPSFDSLPRAASAEGPYHIAAEATSAQPTWRDRISSISAIEVAAIALFQVQLHHAASKYLFSNDQHHRSLVRYSIPFGD